MVLCIEQDAFLNATPVSVADPASLTTHSPPASRPIAIKLIQAAGELRF